VGGWVGGWVLVNMHSEHVSKHQARADKHRNFLCPGSECVCVSKYALRTCKQASISIMLHIKQETTSMCVCVWGGGALCNGKEPVWCWLATVAQVGTSVGFT